MIPRLLNTIILLAIPAILLGVTYTDSPYVFKPDIPDTIKGLQVQFTVKQIKAVNQERAVWTYCLCADITNRNESAQSFHVTYQCKGEQKTRKIEIGARQQRMILVDKCIISGEGPEEINRFYNHLVVEYGQ